MSQMKDRLLYYGEAEYKTTSVDYLRYKQISNLSWKTIVILQETTSLAQSYNFTWPTFRSSEPLNFVGSLEVKLSLNNTKNCPKS